MNVRHAHRVFAKMNKFSDRQIIDTRLLVLLTRRRRHRPRSMQKGQGVLWVAVVVIRLRQAKPPDPTLGLRRQRIV